MEKAYNITFSYEENDDERSYLSFEGVRGMTLEDYCRFCKRFAMVVGFLPATIETFFNV